MVCFGCGFVLIVVLAGVGFDVVGVLLCWCCVFVVNSVV